MEQIYKNIVESFGSLWRCIPRGNTIEVITPYATINDKFVSVFITKQGNDYIVTDGGWYSSNEYEFTQNTDRPFSRLFSCFEHEYGIKTIKTATEITYYYKTTTNPNLIPNLVFDLCNFISAVINASFVSFEDIKEKTTQERFRRNVNNYIATLVPKGNHEFNAKIDEGKYQDIVFNAIIKNSAHKLTVVSYITGSTLPYFRNSLSRANTSIDIIKQASIADHIDKYIAIIDDRAKGCEKGNYYHALLRNTQDNAVDWTQKERLPNLIRSDN